MPKFSESQQSKTPESNMRSSVPSVFSVHHPQTCPSNGPAKKSVITLELEINSYDYRNQITNRSTGWSMNQPIKLHKSNVKQKCYF